MTSAKSNYRKQGEIIVAMDIKAFFETQPPALDFIWNGFVAGTVGALVAPGATGKSYFALQAAMAVAGGDGADILGIGNGMTGKVVYLSAEDPEPVIHQRVHAIGKHLDQNAREAVAERLCIEPCSGKKMNVMDARQAKFLVEYCADTRLVIVDTLSRVHTLDENSNGEMAGLVGQLEFIARETQAAILYLHHVSKGAALGGGGGEQQAARGASSLIDNARWCGYVARMTAEEATKLSERMDGKPIQDDERGAFVRYGASKINYSAYEGDKWFRRDTQTGVLKPVMLKAATKQQKEGNDGYGKEKGKGGRNDV